MFLGGISYASSVSTIHYWHYVAEKGKGIAREFVMPLHVLFDSVLL